MNNTEAITEFVQSTFKRYRMPDTEFFRVYDEDSGTMVDRPLFPSGIADDETLYRLTVCLGMSKESILNCDEQSANKYWEKYPFFPLYEKYLDQWAWDARFEGKKPTAEDFLLNAIWGDEKGILVKRKYTFAGVKERLIKKLKEINTIIPGTYHEGAEITNLSIETEVFFSFPECSQMMRSFLDMVDRMKELFFKALSIELSDEEQQELNFLASWFRAGDAVMPSVLITYDNIQLYGSVYKEENYQDFFSYVKIRRFDFGSALFPSKDLIPWRCREFFDDPSLVQEFVDTFPKAKAEMRNFALLVSNFYCVFTWSDAKPLLDSPELERLNHEVRMIVGEEDVPLEQRAKEMTEIYVEKDAGEIYDWELNIAKINRAISPPSQGGVRLPNRQYDLLSGQAAITRLQKRVDAKYSRR